MRKKILIGLACVCSFALFTNVMAAEKQPADLPSVEQAINYLEARYGPRENWPCDTSREGLPEEGTGELSVGSPTDPSHGKNRLEDNMGHN